MSARENQELFALGALCPQADAWPLERGACAPRSCIGCSAARSKLLISASILIESPL
jgi:hypothetical protein